MRIGAIHINPPEGQVDDYGNLVAIVVTGTVETCKCDRVIVRIRCEGGSRETDYIAPAGSGNTYDWEVTFHLAEGERTCACDHYIHVGARCANDPNCQPAEWEGALPCDGGRCPTISGFHVDVSLECNDDGTRTVTVSANVTPGSETPVFVQWHHDDEDGDSAVVNAPNTPVPDEFDYPADGEQHTATLEVLNPETCPPEVFDPFEVPECPGNGVRCPVTTFADEVISAECMDGKRHVTLKATLTLEEPGSLEARMLLVDPADEDNVLAELDHGSSDTGTLDLVSDDDYAPGDYMVKVEVIEPDDCPGAGQGFHVEECEGTGECPALNGLTVDGCWPGEVTLTADVTLPSLVQEYQWEFGDGQTETGGQTVQHQYAARSNDDPYTAKVTIVRPGRCVPRHQNATAEVPKCPEDDEDDADGPTGCGCPCPVWFWLSVALVVGAAVLIIAAGCTGNAGVIAAAIAVAVVALVSFIAWAIVCGSGSCQLLVWFINIAVALVPILEVLAAILAALGFTTCGIGAAVSGGYLGVVVAVAYYFARAAGCLEEGQ